MNSSPNTDLKVAEDLEKLSSTVREATERAEKILAEAKKMDCERLLQAAQELHQATTKLSVEITKTNIAYQEKTEEAKIILTQLETLVKTESMDAARELASELKLARLQLKETRQEIIGVRSLEAYLQEFQMPRSHKHFRQWLWQELGFAGIIVYFLSLIVPKNRKGR